MSLCFFSYCICGKEWDTRWPDSLTGKYNHIFFFLFVSKTEFEVNPSGQKSRYRHLKEVWAPRCASYSVHQHTTTVSTNQIALNTDRSSVLFLAKQLLRSVSCKQWTRSVRIPHSHTIRMPLYCSDLLLCVRSDWRILPDNTIVVGDRGNDVFHLIKISNARKLTPWAPIFFAQMIGNNFLHLYVVLEKNCRVGTDWNSCIFTEIITPFFLYQYPKSEKIE